MFTDPEHRCVLAEFSDFPAIRSPGCFQAEGHLSPYELLVIFLKDEIQYRLPYQFARRITELGRTKGVRRKDYAARIDHEVHDRIVLEDLPPLPFAPAQFPCGAAAIFGIGASPLHLRYLLSAVADIDAKFLAARLIRREPAACTGMSINTRRQGRSPLFRDSIPSDLGQRLSKSAENCRKRRKYARTRTGSPCACCAICDRYCP